MPRRIEIELTSDRGDGSWTWRAAGAKQPRGVVDAVLLPEGRKVGDVLKVDAEFDIDGIVIVAVAPVQQRGRSEPERIELLGRGRDDDQLVTTQLHPKERRERRDRRDRRDGQGERGDRGGERRDRPPRSDRDRSPRGDRDRERGPRGERSDRPERPDRPDRPQRRPAPPPVPERPKPKRLRPGRTHRKAVLAELAPEHQPIAEEVLRGGIPAVRQAIDAENAKRSAAGEPSINAQELLDIAERLLPLLRTADWRDRAEAALGMADELDVRDLRSVVVASENAARDEETRAMASQLRVKLEERTQAEHDAWVEDLDFALNAGRIVRALRLASRPPKPGTSISPEVRSKLVEGANASLTADVTAERWAAVLDAVAYAPVRSDVEPASKPEAPSDELLAAVRKYASRVPKVAAAFGIEAPAPKPAAGKGLRGKPGRPDRRSGVVPLPARPAAPGALGAPKIPPPPPRSPKPASGQAEVPVPGIEEQPPVDAPPPEPAPETQAPAGDVGAGTEEDEARAETAPDAGAPLPEPAPETQAPAGDVGAGSEEGDEASGVAGSEDAAAGGAAPELA